MSPWWACWCGDFHQGDPRSSNHHPVEDDEGGDR